MLKKVDFCFVIINFIGTTEDYPEKCRRSDQAVGVSIIPRGYLFISSIFKVSALQSSPHPLPTQNQINKNRPL